MHHHTQSAHDVYRIGVEDAEEQQGVPQDNRADDRQEGADFGRGQRPESVGCQRPGSGRGDLGGALGV